MATDIYSLHDSEYFELHLLWIFSHNSHFHKRGQAARAVTGIEIQTHSNFKTSSFSLSLPFPNCNCNWFYIFLVFSGLQQQRRICSCHNFFVPFDLLSRQNLSQTTTASSPSAMQHVGHEQVNGGGISLNIERYKEIVCTIALVQLALVFCYSPLIILLILATVTTPDWYKIGSIFQVSALTVVYFNSTLNPILFCWKIREVREAVKTTVKQIRCFSS